MDLYGRNHDERLWEDPQRFRPERFLEHEPDPHGFIPQGGDDQARQHRCAGEWLTIETMKAALDLLTDAMEYEVPEQDLTVRHSRMPALPASSFAIQNVRLRR